MRSLGYSDLSQVQTRGTSTMRSNRLDRFPSVATSLQWNLNFDSLYSKLVLECPIVILLTFFLVLGMYLHTSRLLERGDK